ncbi:MAG: S-methyl-5-thioribose-1-phosphate isomerase [Armatimonadota bacterium]
MPNSIKTELLPVLWRDGKVVMIDQTRLPEELIYLEFADYREVALAIRTMVVRGAPSIGVAAAFGMALAARQGADLDEAARELAATRPTAVNLFWAIDEMLRVERDPEKLLARAQGILAENLAANRTMGAHGAELIPDGATVLTHCNAGGLAAGGYGTALGVIRAAAESGKRVRVIADETRPRLQGMRLTVWELQQLGIPVTAITDNMAAWAMQKGMVDCVVVGADRIAGNGDTANKVGTYGVAVLARAHGIPFYVAAPISTIDFSIPDGSHIPIEERCETEVTHIGESRIAPAEVAICNPAFDVTPAEYVTAIVTERGVLRAPYERSLR